MKPVDPSASLQQVMALRQQMVERHEALRTLKPAQADSPVNKPETPSTNFADTLGNALDQVNAAQNRSAELAAAYERGEVADIAQVMIARQEAGVAFEATLQVRNKLINAYQEIMRMGA